jgi:alginate O-acetyltransferase complex protein AlgI
MRIISQQFLLLFLPIFLLIYWIGFKKPRGKLWLIFFINYFFYAINELKYLPLLIILSVATFWLARSEHTRLGILINIIPFLVLKYWGLIVPTLDQISNSLNISIPLLSDDISLPLGFSYYLFKHVGYLIDVRNKSIKSTGNIIAFATYSAFFPQISAGPISNFQDTGEKLSVLPNHLSEDNIYNGLLHLSMGLAKKVLIANVLSDALGSGIYSFGEGSGGLIQAWIYILIFSMQLYFDFSGYTDIVIGVGYLIGIKLPINFNNPYLAKNPQDFWERWHITLSMWVRVYIFLPLSRSFIRRFKRTYSKYAQYISNIITMVLVGAWHGVGWGFILWGFYHGVLLNINAWAARKKFPLQGTGIYRIVFIFAVFFGWAIFLSPNLDGLIKIVSDMFGFGGIGSVSALIPLFSSKSGLTFIISLLIAFSGFAEAKNLPRLMRPRLLFLFGVMLVLSIITMGESTDFIYVAF